MSLGDPSSQSPEQFPRESSRGVRLLDDSVERWAIPIGRIGRTRLGLSYGVFFAAAILVAVVLITPRETDNADLPRVVGLATAFWVSGWLVQLVTHFAVTRLLDLPLRHVSVGLLGVEGSPRHWSASRTLMAVLATVASLLVLGSFYRLIEGGFQLPVLSRAPATGWATPSIGFSPHDSVWRSAAWLCWVQAICQMYPLPRSMGRHVIAGLSAVCGYRMNLATQAAIFRRSLSVIAIASIGLGVWIFCQRTEGSMPKWPLVMLLGVMLWMSSRAADVSLIIGGFVRGDEIARPGLVTTMKEKVASYRGRRRLKEALDRERTEAVDASRLDEILNRLHQFGADALSDEDRRILQRVSENMRKERSE